MQWMLWHYYSSLIFKLVSFLSLFLDLLEEVFKFWTDTTKLWSLMQTVCFIICASLCFKPSLETKVVRCPSHQCTWHLRLNSCTCLLIIFTLLIRASYTPRLSIFFNWRTLVGYSFTGNKGPRRHIHFQITSLNWSMAFWKTEIKASPVFEAVF